MIASSAEQLIAAVRDTVSMLEQNSLLRAKYVLQNYSRYRANGVKNLDRRISESVLDILSSHFAHQTQFTSNDEALMDRCGYLCWYPQSRRRWIPSNQCPSRSRRRCIPCCITATSTPTVPPSTWNSCTSGLRKKALRTTPMTFRRSLQSASGSCRPCYLKTVSFTR